MTNHPHLPQICDLLKAGPELAVQVCLGVTETHEEAKELFVAACSSVAKTKQVGHALTNILKAVTKEDWVNMLVYLPWASRLPLEFEGHPNAVKEQILAHYRTLFDQQTTNQ